MKSSIYLAIISVLIMSFCNQTSAQGFKLKQANKYYKELNYQEAIKLYEQILKRKKLAHDALLNLPECYRKTGDYQKAENIYSLAISNIEDINPEVYFYYGLCLLSNSKTSEALAAFEEFKKLNPADTRANKLIASCNDSIRNVIENAGALYNVRNVEEINTQFDEFGVTIYKDGIVYCAERDTAKGPYLIRNSWTGRPFTDVYTIDAKIKDARKKEYQYGKEKPFANVVKSKFHDGPVTFADDSTMYFTANFKKKSVKNNVFNTQISKVTKTGEKWSKTPDIQYISDLRYSVAHPTISTKGDKIYFSSDMEGGFGKMDIYVAYLENGSWSDPINLGPEINTEGDEVFPWLDYDGTLYFASDGHSGLGGLDIYSSEGSRGKFSTAQNIGSPINSNFDDFSFSIDSSRLFGYFSSNREGGKGLNDIYSYTKLALNAELLVFNKQNGKPFSNVLVKTDCFPRDEYYSDNDGKIFISLPLNRDCQFTLTSSEFADTTILVSTKGFDLGAQLFFKAPIEAGQTILTLNGNLVNDKTGSPISGAKVELLSNCETASLVSNTDSYGNFSFKIKANCQYVIKGMNEGYFTSAMNLNTIGQRRDTTYFFNIKMTEFFKDASANQYNQNNNGNINPDGTINLNGDSSLIQIENIYFDYNSAVIDINRSAGLVKLLDLMKNNANINVHINAHTDSRGDITSNLNLSQRRAKAIADYLVNKGIQPSRMTFEGSGESKLQNGCRDNVNCTEEQHRVNRRTEFTVKKASSN